MPPKPRPALLLPALLLVLLISSATFLVAKRTLVEFPALPLALFRFALAVSLLLPLARWLRPGKRIEPADRGRVWLLGLLVAPINQVLFLIGMKWASASHAALIYALTPAFVVLIVLARGGGRPSLLQIVGLVLAFAGVVLLLVQRGLHFDRSSLTGDLIIFVAVIAWAGYLVLGGVLTRRYGPLLVTSEALFAGAILFLPIGLPSLAGFHPSQISPAGWAGLVYLAVLSTVVNYVLWFWALEYLKPTTVATLTNVQPIVTAAMARAFLGERLPAGFVVSAVLVLAGVWITRATSGRVAPVEHEATTR